VNTQPQDCAYPPFPVIEGVRFGHARGFPGYAVSDDGNIWCCKNPNGARDYVPAWRKKTLCWTGGGGKVQYLGTQMTDEHGKPKSVKVHRMVLLTFVGDPPPGTEATHFPSSDRTNNKITNLAWRTRKDNIHDQIRDGVHRCWEGGEKHHFAKLAAAAVADIRTSKDTRKELGKKHGVTPDHIGRIQNGGVW